MQRAHWFGQLVSVGGIALILAACGDDSTTGGSNDSGSPDSGPIATPDAGEDPAMMPPKGPPLSDAYSLEACPGAAPVMMIELFDVLPDCSDICGGGRCVPSALAGMSSGAASALPDCPDGLSKCIPLDIATTGGSFKFQPCASTVDPNMMGACVPTCLVPADQRSFLMAGTCDAGELCAPCINILDGMPTGACDLLECPGEGGNDGGSADGG